MSLEQSEYLVNSEDGLLSVTITISEIQLQDVIIEVTVTDGNVTGINYIKIYILIHNQQLLL